jgi:mannose-6-phosphate isomerase-like protein (cupin superfamily)
MLPEFYPEFVRALPEADIPIDGVKAWLHQGSDHQIVFMEFTKDAEVPAHSHEAQWGVVLDGEAELTIDGKPRVLKKGDSYWLEAGQVHSAKIYAGYKDLTFFNQRDRYKIKRINAR